MLNKFILGMISRKSGWVDNSFSTNADWDTTWYKKNIIYWRSSIVRVRGWQYFTIFNKNWKVIPTVPKIQFTALVALENFEMLQLLRKCKFYALNGGKLNL